MYSTLKPIYIRSVPSNFSWDDGEFYVTTSSIVPSLTVDDKPVYVGYAPITYALIESSPFNFSPNSSYYIRSINFGDYYHSNTNILNLSGADQLVQFGHSYIMPGLYSITLDEAEYSNVNKYTWNQITTLSNPNLIWTEYTGISADTINGTTVVPNVTALVTGQTSNFLISVVEIPPTAYLSANISTNAGNIVFPLTITITPRYTRTGSFPIEKIVWDFGDGSPLVTKRRWDKNTVSPFLSTDALSADLIDPRNFDVTHTYTKQNTTQFSFYPSITAYASSTGTTDVCSITIGPVRAEPLTEDFTILHTDLNEDGVVMIGQVGSQATGWKTK
jgi:hypothetical protein